MKRASRRRGTATRTRRSIPRKASSTGGRSSRSRAVKSVSVKKSRSTTTRTRSVATPRTHRIPRTITIKSGAKRKVSTRKASPKVSSSSKPTTAHKQTQKRDSKGRFVGTASRTKSSSSKKNEPRPKHDTKRLTRKVSAGTRTRSKRAVIVTSSQSRLVSYVGSNGSAISKNKELYVAKNMPIEGGSLKKQEQIVSAVADNFTKNELDCMIKNRDDLKVTVGKVPKEGADASFKRKYGPNEKNQITIDDKTDSMGITHEFVHLSRATDKNRTGITRTVFRTDKDGIADKKERYGSSGNRLINAEESATSAEAAMRVSKPGNAPGYFANLGEKNCLGIPEHYKKDENLKEDRKTLRRNKDGMTVPDGVVIKGKEAIKKMNANYKDTRISQRKEGDETALSTAEKATRKK